MRLVTLALRQWRFLTILLPLTSVAGCYISDKPLMTANLAVFPFEAVTYQLEGAPDSATLVRTSDGYLMIAGSQNYQDLAKLLFYQLADSWYVVEMLTSKGTAYATIGLDTATATAYTFDTNLSERTSIADLTDYLKVAELSMRGGRNPDQSYVILSKLTTPPTISDAVAAHERKDLLVALTDFRFLAANGNVEAQTTLGDMYYSGEGVPQYDAVAALWFRTAAEQGNGKAENNLGLLYEKGRGVQQSNVEAARWYERAAADGDPLARKNFEDIEGKLLPAERQVIEIRRLAERGNAEAENKLGVLYEQGLNVPVDDGEAAKWYRKSADQGVAAGEYDLGRMYDRGGGVDQDYSEAAKWYLYAAKQGYADAQYSLGSFYETGQGVALNVYEAMRLYRLAADQGHSEARAALVRLKDLPAANSPGTK
jgi:TPR repeat protein